MNALMLRDLLLTLDGLSGKPDVRRGVVSAAVPLAVKLGGSDVAYTNVVCLDGLRLAVGDSVMALMFGGDLIVLGRVTTNGGTVRGVVNADGTVNRGSGFTATKHATGFYSAYFTAAFATAPVVQVSSHAGEPNGIYLFSVSTTEVQVVIEQSPGNRLDAIWHFIAMAV